MPSLVTLADFQRASGVQNKLIATGVFHFAGLDKLNRLYSSLYPFKGRDFVSAFFDQANIELKVDERELLRVPETGSFITISNHPYGGVDGLALLELIASRRPDYKVMANFLLKKIEPISDYFIGVNPFETHKHVASSVAGMRQGWEHLNGGSPLGLFPAGEVSTYQRNGKVEDREWQATALKLIKNAQVPVIPVYFHGCNSWSFHFFGKLHPMLRTLRLPHELVSRKKRTIQVRIGTPITVEEQNSFSETDAFSKYLRARTYSLGSPFEEKKNGINSIIPFSKQSPVRSTFPKDILVKEIGTLQHRKIFVQQDFELYLASSTEIPSILQEIGRLREITFRSAGEGTNKQVDLDRFDEFYDHLFLYDRHAMEIVGAYRIGNGSHIIAAHGIKGFYTNSLFRMKDEFIPILEKSVELGRSFIRSEYQNKRLPLFLLWKGIASVLKDNPHYRYVIGPVSISNAYSSVSKSLLIAFIQRYYFDHKLATLITPRKKYKVDERILKKAESLLESSGNDLAKLDKIIQDIEPAIKSAPVLLKKYIQQNAQIIGFNVDPEFNQALDGLMILDVNKLPDNSLDNFTMKM